MHRKLTATTTLDNIKKQAKRWLKALRENDAAARERLQQVHSNAPAKPVLRDVQYALAREYGQNSWKELKQALESRPAQRPGRARPARRPFPRIRLPGPSRARTPRTPDRAPRRNADSATES